MHDPFSGSGAIPLEAQRLGLEPHASDLNPVAVLINKATIEIPQRFSGCAPVGPIVRNRRLLDLEWTGAMGLAEDVRRYGDWMREEAEKRFGHLYPQVEVTKAMVKERPDLEKYQGQKLTIIASLWARTVKSPAPAFAHVDVPLASTFVLSSKEGKQSYVEAVTKKDSYRFIVKTGKPPKGAEEGTKLGRGANFRCVVSSSTIEPEYIYREANAGRMGTRLMAVVAEGTKSRVYLSPTDGLEQIAREAKPSWSPELAMPENPRWFSPPLYGLKTYGDLFTARQLVSLTTLSELVREVRGRVLKDARAAGMSDDERSLESGGAGAAAYADAIATYLAFALDRHIDYGSTLATWRHKDSAMRASLSMQAIPMTWDFAEASPLASSSAGWTDAVEVVARTFEFLVGTESPGFAQMRNATESLTVRASHIISTDPPYYDNVGYADLSDFFYVWLRRSLRDVWPSLLATVAVPKSEELIASPYRHGSKDAAESFFLSGMTDAMRKLARHSHPCVPLTIYYAFKQSETNASGTTSSGWETFLGAVLGAGLSVTGTWPMKTEGDNRRIGVGTNALASSIILVCRPRSENAPSISRREFIRELNRVLPIALDEMTKGVGEDQSPVAPVDLSQAIIGPGMAVFSKYSAVLEADGNPMSVKSALQLINRFLAESDFDEDTQFCLAWFEQNRWEAGPYGDADVLARAKATSVSGVVDAGVVMSKGGKVRLLKPAEYPAEWDPKTDKRLPVWEALHQLIFNFKTHGESGAARVLAAVADRAEPIRQLAYRLYTLCERQRLSEDARGYNELITSWVAIETASASIPQEKPEAQLKLI